MENPVPVIPGNCDVLDGCPVFEQGSHISAQDRKAG
jgi:hypothetical protein